jgi:hypothetical protein
MSSAEAPTRRQVSHALVADDTLYEMDAYDVLELRDRGFEGFVRVADLGPEPEAVPTSPGVYVVARVTDKQPTFVDRSPGSWFKGKDPTVPVSRLREEWVDGAQTLYIGSGVHLRDRIGLLVEFSNAGPTRSVFHWGGRLLWQLIDSQDLQVAWREEPEGIGSVERDLVHEFKRAFGRLPFANLRRPPIRATTHDCR